MHLAQALRDIREQVQIVVRRHGLPSVNGTEVVAHYREREVQGFRGHLLKVLVALHRREAEGVLQLLHAPQLGRPLGSRAQRALELLRNAKRIDQRAVQVERKRFRHAVMSCLIVSRMAKSQRFVASSSTTGRLSGVSHVPLNSSSHQSHGRRRALFAAGQDRHRVTPGR